MDCLEKSRRGSSDLGPRRNNQITISSRSGREPWLSLISEVNEDSLQLKCLDDAQPLKVVRVGPFVTLVVLELLKEYVDVFVWALMTS